MLIFVFILDKFRMNNEPSGSKPVAGGIVTRTSNGPSILRRKRKLPVDEDSPPHLIPIEKAREEVIRWSGLDYARDLALRYSPAALMHVRSCPMETMQDGIVLGRLRGKGANCDLTNLSCRVNLCGRQFDTVQVLAWHMSYSHTDLSSRSTNAALCFVCGHQMATAKGKVAHLLSKHRDIFQQHHEQCLEQQQVVYAPNAPGAVRLRENPLDADLL